MRLTYLWFPLAAAFLCVYASIDKVEPDVQVVTSFPDNNPFGHVVNGERNEMFLNVTNKSSRNVTLLNVGGSFHHPETHALVKNISTTKYNLELPNGSRVSLPYKFYSEFKPGDIRLNLWLEHKTDNETYRIAAYDSIVTVVEPEASIFDFKLISTYLVLALIFGALAYFVVISLVPQSRKTRPKKPVASTAHVADSTATATDVSGYQPEWIPEHHMKKTKAGKKKSGTATSGEEQSGPDTSGTEGKVRRGKR